MMNRSPLSRWLTTERLLILFAPGILVLLSLNKIGDPDLWWHLKTGEWILDHRAIPRNGLWSWVGEEREWLTHEWLFDVLAAGLYRLAGLPSLVVAKAVLVGVAFLIVARHARARGGSAGLACLLTLWAGYATIPFTTERPQLLTYVLTAFFLWVLDGWQRGERRTLWMLAPLVMIWANLHGAYVVAFLLLGAYGVGEIAVQGRRWADGQPVEWSRARHLGIVAAASLVLALVNPHGIALFTYPFRYLGAKTLTRYVQEWFSPDFRDPRFQPFGLFLVFTLATMAASPLRPRVSRLLVLLLFTTLALYSQRNVPLVLIAAVPMLAEHLAPLAGERARAKTALRPLGQLSAVNWVALAVLLLLIGWRLPRGPEWRDPVWPDTVPKGAVSYLKAHSMPGRMMNHYAWGGYLIWTLAPQYKVFIDGRADIYGDEVIEDFVTVWRVRPGWDEVLEKYRIDWMLWPKTAAVAQLLRASPAWQVTYEDKQAVLFTRSPAREDRASER
jgi:hypothetical protein